MYQKSPLYHQFQAIKSQGKGRGGIKQEGQPKRATTAYMYFTAEVRPERASGEALERARSSWGPVDHASPWRASACTGAEQGQGRVPGHHVWRHREEDRRALEGPVRRGQEGACSLKGPAASSVAGGIERPDASAQSSAWTGGATGLGPGQPYEAKAERDRKRYEVENSAFQAKLGRVGDEAGHDDDDGDDDDDDAEDDDDDE